MRSVVSNGYAEGRLVTEGGAGVFLGSLRLTRTPTLDPPRTIYDDYDYRATNTGTGRIQPVALLNRKNMPRLTKLTPPRG